MRTTTSRALQRRRSRRPAAVLAAAVAVVGTALAVPGPAAAKGGTIAPVVVSPADGAVVEGTDALPIRVDFTDAAPGTWLLTLDCSDPVRGGTAYWQESISYDGTDPIRTVTPNGRVDARRRDSTCTIRVDDSPTTGAPGSVWSQNVFTLKPGPLEMSVETPFPAEFYPRVQDGYLDSISIPFTVNRAANVAVSIRDADDRVVHQDETHVTPGRNGFAWSGHDARRDAMAKPGEYRIQLVATNDVDKPDADDVITSEAGAVTVATKTLVKKATRSTGGSDSRRVAKGSCTARADVDADKTALDCRGGRWARATYVFTVPRDAYDVTFTASGQFTEADICCQGSLTKTGTRVDARRYRVRVQVDGWRAYDVRGATISYKYTKQL